MKKIFPAAFTISALFIFGSTVYGQTYFNVKVTVLDNNDEPVAGATVTVSKPGEPSQVFTGSSDQNGVALVNAKVTGAGGELRRDHRFKVTVTKPNYSVGTAEFTARDN